jgi:hypothetical protein
MGGSSIVIDRRPGTEARSGGSLDGWLSGRDPHGTVPTRRHPNRSGETSMTRHTIRALLAAGMLIAAGTAASAQGSGSGSGLSINPEATGNDRSAGVNNGNNRSRGYGYRGYDRGYGRPVYDRYEGRRRGPYYGYPY